MADENIRGSITVVTMTAASVEVLGPSEKRINVMFCKGPANTGTIALNNRALASANDGFAAANVCPAYPMPYRDYGDLVRGPWFAWGTVNTDKLIVIETLQG